MADLAAQPTSIQSLYSWYRDDKLFVNRRYQRKLVWTLHEKQKLIESILNKYPVPAILLAERENQSGSYEIIDGLQRLHAIISFVETTFPTLDGKLFDLSSFPTARSRADEGHFKPGSGLMMISQREVSVILDYTLAVSVMRNATEEQINDVFGRINTYGHRLSDQERRQAGVQNDFSNMVRKIACTVRGDASSEILPLRSMPEISIDLPMSRHGYTVKAEEVFWVAQGILRSTDLRDSMDEQCIADIAACIVNGELLERSKEALDQVYDPQSLASQNLSASLQRYGTEKFSEEFKYCVDRVLEICGTGETQSSHLRKLLFAMSTTNAYPSVFAALLIALHETLIKDNKVITSYVGIRESLTGVSTRINTGQKGTTKEERRRNVDVFKGLISNHCVAGSGKALIYGNHATVDIEELLRRSELESANYELKQGMLTLDHHRSVDAMMIEKVMQTICAIANIGPHKVGKVIIGVTDKYVDAERIEFLDGVKSRKVGQRYVVGFKREAEKLGISSETYNARWRSAIQHSLLSPALRDSVFSNLDHNDFYGLGVLVDDVFWRSGDATVKATTMKQSAELAMRF